MLRTDELEYDLPPELIATAPAQPRDAAWMMVISRSDAGRMEHARVRDLPAFLKRGDLLVMNTTAVIPARLRGRREQTGGRIEGLYLHDDPPRSGRAVWVVLLQGGHLRPGVVVQLHDGSDQPTGVHLTLIERHAEEAGGWRVEVSEPGESSAILARAGLTPLPPYIQRIRALTGQGVDDGADRAGYQTVYADRAQAGSVAAPTAGLHFTPALLERLCAVRVERADVVLHVGTGTFRPVEAEFLEQHPMHSERCTLPGATRSAIQRARAEGRRVIPVGSTAVRTLESFAPLAEAAQPTDGWLDTRLLIAPGFAWRWADGMLTNFHLPRSTLLALVAAFLPGGIARVKETYAEAIRRTYRFYSFGDAMLILP